MDKNTTKLYLYCARCKVKITHGTIWQHHQEYHKGKALVEVGVK